VPFHAAAVFGPGTWYIKAAEPHAGLTYTVSATLDPWHMPLLFLLAGQSAWLALGRMTGRRYIIDRLRRLLIPFVVGVVAVVPLGQYAAARHHGTSGGSLADFWPRYWAGVVDTDLAGFTGGFAIAHLWFLAVLFMITVVSLPLLAYWRTPDGVAQRQRLTRIATQPLVLGALPLIGGLSLLPSLWIAGRAPAYYLLMFVAGVLMASDPAIEEALVTRRRVWLGLGVVLLLAPIAAYASGWAQPPNLILDAVRYAGASWYLVLGFLGFARRHTSTPGTWLHYWNEAGMPFYILHQPVLVISGYWLMAQPLPAEVSFVGLVAVTALVSSGLYHLVIRHVNWLRWAFGLRSQSGRAISPK
jgi:peptidoglycan/LPS O-acetylase OafA/YrhL